MLTPAEVQQVTMIARQVALQTPSLHGETVSRWLEVWMLLTSGLNLLTMWVMFQHLRRHKHDDPTRV